MQVRLKLEYDGTNYSGWQLQIGQDSIQARLEDALARIFGSPIRVRAAGRTEPVLHARGQVAAARLPRHFDPAELTRALNAILPADVVVLKRRRSATTPTRARRAASIYEYHVLNQPLRSAFEHSSAWLVRERLDIDAMNVAAAAFVGEHDFAAFRSLGSVEQPPCAACRSAAGVSSKALIETRLKTDAVWSTASRPLIFAPHGAHDGGRDGRGWTRKIRRQTARAYRRRVDRQPRPRAGAGTCAGRRTVPGRGALLAAALTRNACRTATSGARDLEVLLPQWLEARAVEKSLRFLIKTRVLLVRQLANDLTLAHALLAKLAVAQGG